MPVFSAERRTARKPRPCSDCGRTIGVGEVYRRGVTFIDGTVWTWADCTHCDYVQRVYGDRVTVEDGAYTAESFYEWAYDGEALSLAEARMMAGYRRRWRTASGNLWPIPEGAAS